MRTAAARRLSAFVRRRVYDRGVGRGPALALRGCMLKMSIRRKLFLAFALVAAISSAALLLFARSYMANERAQLDRRFLDQAHGALEQLTQRTETLEREGMDVISDGSLDPQMLTAVLVD